MINLQIQKIEGLWCGVALESKRIFATTFAFNEKDALKSLLKELPYNTIFQAAQKKNALAEEVLRTIRAIFYGEDVSFSFQFAMTRLSDYAKRVLELTSLIPTGYVTTYGVLAKAAGGSPRSVGGVMATNPFAPLVPCHRVVAADMTLGGYGGGLKTKWGILQRENRKYETVVKAEINTKTLKLFPVDRLKPSKY
ncbi:MAG: methylated-DNA--[protein]-cysteine S-methyltransferase [Candidatus Bathyarchaeota archaeon]|nr:methylated-DNA--[protein]-cysteine S-methyltransferase [Candidatus Bathyarchaeota archaeon]